MHAGKNIKRPDHRLTDYCGGVFDCSVEVLDGGVTRLHLRLKVRPDIGGHATVVALVDLTEASATSSNASWRTSTELDPMLAVMAGQRVEEFLRSSIDHLIAGLAS